MSTSRITQFYAPLVIALLFAGSMATVCTAVAQDSKTTKLFLNATLGGQSLFFDENSLEHRDAGGSISFRAGWGFSDLFTLHIGVNGAQMQGDDNPVVDDGDYEWGAFEIGGRFNFRSGKSLVPFADVALRAVAAVREDVDLEFLGGGFTLGGGVAYYLSRSIALEAGLRLGAGGFNEVKLGAVSFDLDPDNFGFGERRFSLGLVFYPLR